MSVTVYVTRYVTVYVTVYVCHIATPRISEEYEGRSSGSKLRNIEKPGSASCDLEIRILGALGRISEIKIKSGSLPAMN